MKINYWNNFYKKFNLKKPSLFAKFVLKKLKKNSLLLEVGCGNGRDTFFFLKNNIRCTAYDISKTAIVQNRKLFNKVFYKKKYLQEKREFKKKLL